MIKKSARISKKNSKSKKIDNLNNFRREKIDIN
jgi:hypothetical protein